MYKKLIAEELNNFCAPDVFGFETTSDLPEFEGTIGQTRAQSALEFGLDVSNSVQGFNIYALGQQGTGKMTTVKNLILKKAASETVPPDQCYVYNFAKPDYPRTLELHPGEGVIFQKDMVELTKVLRAEITKVFESKEYEKQKNKIFEALQIKQRDLFSELEDEAKNNSFSIRKLTHGLVVAPVKKDGEALTDEEFAALDADTKKNIEKMGKRLQEQLDDVVRQVRQGEKEAKKRVRILEREIAQEEVRQWIAELQSKYRESETVLKYLEEVYEDVLDNLSDFKAQEEGQQPAMMIVGMGMKPDKDFTRYKVNVMVDNKGITGAPVVIEENPTYFNLFGRVEHRVQNGMAFTDFTMIKAGSMHRANGGYIVIDALDLLKNIFAYDGLKRALKNRCISMDDVWEQYRMVSIATMRPEPIPLNVKVVLVGSPYIYYLLYNLDEDYKKLFKVKADFDGRMERNEGTLQKYASFIANSCRNNGLKPFDRTGVAKVVEYGSRLADHQEKLSARFGNVADLIMEADYWAGKDGSKVVSALHVEKARKEKIYRNSRIEDLMKEATLEDTLIIETSGSKVGQINALTVIGTGDYMFGRPSRITSRVFAGKAGVVNIERETKMSGKVHEKAIVILSSYIGGKYAHKKPISLSASIGFEQLYEGVEGDSATCAELYVLLSSITGIALKQNIAVTGSMDQHGEVQPVGGVNEKIEGFFDICAARGLDKSQGVIIPARNIRNLMLRSDVVDAVKKGNFHIYAIDKAEDALQVLTDMPAGEMNENGEYPEATVNHAVMKRLIELADAHKEKKKENSEEDKESVKLEKLARQNDKKG